MNPFEEQAQNVAAYQDLVGMTDGTRDGGAMLSIFSRTVPCTHTDVHTDFQLEPGGRSAKTFIEAIEFLASDLPADAVPIKGIKCTLTVRPGGPALALKLWPGGLQAGGLVYRFMAVDENYGA